MSSEPQQAAIPRIRMTPAVTGREKTRTMAESRASHLRPRGTGMKSRDLSTKMTCQSRRLEGMKAEAGETSSRQGVAATATRPRRQEEAGITPSLLRQCPGTKAAVRDTMTSPGIPGQRRMSQTLTDTASSSLQKTRGITSMISRLEKMTTSAPCALAHPSAAFKYHET